MLKKLTSDLHHGPTQSDAQSFNSDANHVYTYYQTAIHQPRAEKSTLKREKKSCQTALKPKSLFHARGVDGDVCHTHSKGACAHTFIFPRRMEWERIQKIHTRARGDEDFVQR